MSIRMQAICIETTDPASLGRWWAEALGWRLTYEVEHEVVLEPPLGSPEDGISPDLLFLKVPGGKAGKNRIHFDLRPTDQSAEVERFVSLGAQRVDIGQGDDTSWVVLADPDGNEFCILRAFTAEELASF